jgi:hypothetical protein
MSELVRCPAVITEPELAAATQTALAGVLSQHLAAAHPTFSWPDYYVQQNCHSSPWHVRCPAVPAEPQLVGSSSSDLAARLAAHLKMAHPTFSWPNWYVPANCHSSPTAVPTGP